MITGYVTGFAFTWFVLWATLTGMFGWKLTISSGATAFTATLIIMLLVIIGHLVANRAKYREFREFCRDVFPAGHLDSVANQRLAYLASYTRKCNEDVLLLQQHGASAFKGKHPFDWSPEELRTRLEASFKRAADHFYETYDTFKRLEMMAYLTFKERDWKAYAGEPELKKVG